LKQARVLKILLFTVRPRYLGHFAGNLGHPRRKFC
jgi:hypothetical protein